MKRIPLITLVGLVCFVALSLFTQHHATAERSFAGQSPLSTQSPVQTPGSLIKRPVQTIIGDDGTITTAADDGEATFVPGEILVKFRNESDALEAGRGIRTAAGHLKIPNARLSSIFARFGIKNGRRPFAHAKLRSLGKVVKLTTEVRQDRQQLTEMLDAMRAQPEVEYAELNVIMHTQTAPNDPYYSSSGAWGQTFRDLWGLQAINAEAAWDTSQGDGVIVAVVDTGLDYNHEDISGNVWQNDGEIGLDASGNDKRSNGVDDDADGFIDDWRGWDFVTVDGTPGDNDPMDNHGHGTHVSGTIAATGNNGLGITGVAPHAKIMAVKGLDAFGSGSTEDLSSAIIYAADRGASILNLSWGGSGSTPQTLIDAISYAHNTKGAVVVAAAGNSNANVGAQANGFYPACIRDVIAVSAVNHNDARASFSNFGAKIDIGAPGGGDTDPTGLLTQPDRSILSLLSSSAGSSMTGSGQLVVGTKYLRQAGTSMASPHVAGAAALIRALHPEFSPEQVRQALRAGADDIGTPGVDTQFGSGRLNSSRPLTIAAPLMAQLTSPNGTLSGVSQVEVKGSVGGMNLSSWRLEYGVGTAPSSWTLINTSTATINAGTLATWNLSGINDGTYTLHLVAQALTGEIYEDRLAIVLDGLVITDPSPLALSITRGEQGVTIRGTVASANFARYGIGILALRSNTWVSNSAITLANGGLQPVHDDVLGTWNTTGAAPDTYRIYVTEIFTNSSSVYKSVEIAVDSTLHPGWPKDLGVLGNGISAFALTHHLDVSDIDGNGTKDLIIAYNTQVNILDHTGAQLPGWPQTVDPQNSGAHIQISPAVADLDGDGSPEILACNDQGKVFVWRGNGTLWAGWPKSLASIFTNIAVDDLNGDGQKEIIISTYGSVRVFNTAGVAWPGFPVFTNASNTPPAIGDVDGDGQKEIVVATNPGPTKLYMIKANGTVMPNWPRSINPSLPPNYTSSSSPVLGDLDGDGTMECVIGSTDGLVYAFRADGSYLTGWPQATKAAYVNTPAIGDLDGDGLPEVVAGNDKFLENGVYTNYIFAWHANGTALPNWPVKYDGPFGASFFGFSAPALVDLDQDGRADVIASSDGPAVNAYKSDGSKIAGFPKPTLRAGAYPTNTAALADIDGDGLMEMAWIDNNLYVYLWDLSAPSTAVAPWPMFHHDAAHTGASVRTPEVIAPVTAVISPGDGTRVAGKVNVIAQATDNVGVTNIELYKDNVLVGSSTTSPYTFAWNTAADSDGPHTFTSKAFDAAGNVGTSLTITIHVDNTPPTANVSSPSDGALVGGSTIAISANASDGAGMQKVDFYYDSSVLVGTDTAAPFTVNWNISNVPDGVHSLFVVATDTAGNTATSATISVTLDRTLPTVSLTAPSNNAVVSGTAVGVSANAADNIAVGRVDFYRDGNVLLGSDNSSPFAINWNTTSTPSGAHTITAVAVDTAGNTNASSAVSVTVDNTGPVVSLSAPTNGAFVTGTLTISATASDNVAVSKVEFYRDGSVLLTTDTSSPYSLSWNSTTVTDGAHTLYAIAQDTAGNRTTSASINITVDNTAPTVAITSPANGAQVSRNSTVNINANASDNTGVVKVEFYVNNTLTCTDTAAVYTCAWHVPNQKTTFSLKAMAYDAVGKTATHTISVTSK